ncbi:J domain-containing protein DDB_G0295729-like isoform X2 [Nasonia vitripennis]|uniref:CCHC-type domain-containing protein n=1 Tax=Nasonia vitripennis TaxID=7425 RepID=A0A7M7GC81_NASVI|nr:J domain-containing protein DDB_G0295729-like isoform X2 [Nasonia vitripennis]
MDQLLSSNTKNNVELSTNRSNIKKPRVITKFTKPVRKKISSKENILEQESTTATLTETSNSKKESSVYSNESIFMDPPNTLQTQKTDCLQTRLAKLESSFPAKISLLKEHNNNENSSIDSSTPAKKRLALLIKKMRETKFEPSKTSQSVQDDQHSNHGLEKENGSFVNNKASSNDFIPFVDSNSQSTPNDWSLSPQVWPKASPQTAQWNAEPSNQFISCNQTDSTQSSPATTKTMPQSDDKANKDGKTPAQRRLTQLLQKLRNSSSVKSYLASATPPEPSVSSSNTDCNNFRKKTGSGVCYNCGSPEHSFPVCPEP